MILKGIVFTVILVFFIPSFVSSLGISPGLKDIDFLPGQEVQIPFYVLDASADSIYDVYIRGGDLMPYSTISADSIKGGGSFILTIKFPNSIDEPGYHTISVAVKERPSESAFIGTLIEIGSNVRVFVPYPGLYGELSLSVPDGNVGDQIPIEMKVINRGNQVLSLQSVYVDFVSSDGILAKTLNFTPVDIQVNDERYFRKYLNTEGVNAGNYYAKAHISYAGIDKEINKSFRMGSLFVNITNYTKIINKGGIQKFYVTLESRWNSPISGVYVDVNMSNGLGEQYLFRTPSIDLNPWEKKEVESYFDTDRMSGNYNLTLNASYNGMSTFVYGNFLIEENNMPIYLIVVAGVIILGILLYLVIKHFKKIK